MLLGGMAQNPLLGGLGGFTATGPAVPQIRRGGAGAFEWEKFLTQFRTWEEEEEERRRKRRERLQKLVDDFTADARQTRRQKAANRKRAAILVALYHDWHDDTEDWS